MPSARPLSPLDAEPLQGRVALLGLGVMGGSLARALSAHDGVRVSGWSPDARERHQALDVGAVEAAPARWEDLLAPEPELVVLATPLSSLLELLPEVGSAAPHAILTDVGSLKAPMETLARHHGLGDRWVGSHPMAGSEASGFLASRADLYRDATVWLVEEDASAEARARVRSLWAAVGARAHPMEATRHDALMAQVSHLPQLTANALARTLENAGVSPSSLGPGGRDMTRLAGSSSTMWVDLLRHAPDELPQLIRRLAQELEGLGEALEEGRFDELASMMEKTRAWTRSSGGTT